MLGFSDLQQKLWGCNMNKILILPLIFCILVITGCTNKTELSEKQVAECRQVIENYFADRSVNLSDGDYYRYLSMDIIKKYCHEKFDGYGSKVYHISITKETPEYVSCEYDKKASEDENNYWVDRIGRCSKFEFRFHVICIGEVTQNDVEYYDEPKVFDTVFLMLFEHGKPKIAEVGFIDFVYDKDLPRLLENLGLQQSAR